MAKITLDTVLAAQHLLTTFACDASGEAQINHLGTFDEAVSEIAQDDAFWSETTQLKKQADHLFNHCLVHATHNPLKVAIAKRLCSNATRDGIAKDKAFALNSATILLQAAKRTADEDTANVLYSEAHAIFDENEDVILHHNDIHDLGHTLLDNLSPAFQNQVPQAKLLKQYVTLTQQNGPVAITQDLRKKSGACLNEYMQNKIPALKNRTTEEQMENHVAHYRARIELSKLTLSNPLLFAL